jgi:hypothetical protein
METLRHLLAADYSKDVVGALFAYLFHRISYKELKKELLEDHEAEATARILKCVKLGYVNKNCKLFAYAWYHYRFMKAQGKLARKPKPSEFEVHEDDVKILKLINLDHLGRRLPKPWSIKDMDSRITSFTESKAGKEYIGKFISRKLLFLTKSYGVTRDELVNKMISAAIFSVYKQYPRFKNDLHFVNTLKNKISAEGKTLISYYTRQCRQALYHDGEQHQAVNVSADLFLANIEAPGQYMSHIRDSLQSLAALPLGETAQYFLKLATGQHDEEFSAFLKADNSNAVDSMAYPRYLQKVQQYMSISDERLAAFFTKLRRHI